MPGISATEIRAAVFAAVLLVAACSAPCRALSLSGDTAKVNFGTFTKADLDKGFKELTPSDTNYALRITVADAADTDWTLLARAETPHFESPRGVKPCGDLMWRINSGGNYTPFTTYDTAVASGRGQGTVDLDFKLIADWSNTPDTYGITVVYTIVAD